MRDLQEEFWAHLFYRDQVPLDLCLSLILPVDGTFPFVLTGLVSFDKDVPQFQMLVCIIVNFPIISALHAVADCICMFWLASHLRLKHFITTLQVCLCTSFFTQPFQDWVCLRLAFIGNTVAQ